jgi:hypothetical protein
MLLQANGKTKLVGNRPEVEFTTGRFGNPRLNDPRVWEAAVAIATELLMQLGYFGKFTLKPSRKVRWQGNHALLFKASRHDDDALVLTIKPSGLGNDSAYEYALVGRFKDWDARLAYFKVKELTQAAGVNDPEETATVKTEKPKADLATRITQLQATAARNDSRRKQIEELHDKQAKVRAQIAALEADLNGLETNELQLLDEIEQDRECVEASQALEVLEKLLG